MTAADLLLSLLMGIAASIAVCWGFHEKSLAVRAVIATVCAASFTILFLVAASTIGLAVTGVPGAGVTTIAPPGGVR